jgi:uncharacterized protein YbaP (TraB family)
MKKWIWIVILQILAVNTLSAQENSLFWKIEKKGYKTSYLLGTMHSNDPRILATQDHVLPYLKKVKAYAGEIIFKESDVFALFPYIFEKDSAKQTGNLLNDEELALCKTKVEEALGSGMEKLIPKMSPYMLSIFLQTGVSTTTENSSENLFDFLDMSLQNKAEKWGKKLISLESIASQFSYIQNIDAQEQKEHLLKILHNEDTSSIDGEELMIQWYINNDLLQLQKYIEANLGVDPLLTLDFITDRNLVQKNNMVLAMKKQATFTAVGAAHLPGENGIISLLRKEGFTLTPL